MLHCRRVHYSNWHDEDLRDHSDVSTPCPVHRGAASASGWRASPCSCQGECYWCLPHWARQDWHLSRNISITINCGGTTGWRRVGYLDMTDPSQSCPSGLALKTYSPGLRSCGRATKWVLINEMRLISNINKVHFIWKPPLSYLRLTMSSWSRSGTTAWQWITDEQRLFRATTVYMLPWCNVQKGKPPPPPPPPP